MAKLKGLGRGLDALLGEGETTDGERLLTLPVESLVPGKYQPRTRMDEGPWRNWPIPSVPRG
jgi:ParB family chromosome partitioning protein